jgi:hypothetical protein
VTTPDTTSGRSPDALPRSWQRLLALSGIAFIVLLVAGFFIGGGDAPDYAATDQQWTNWADDNETRSGIGGFLSLLAGFAFLHFAGTIRSLLGDAHAPGSVTLARVAFGGGLVAIAGITTALVIIASATAEGADANPVVSRAVATTSAGPFLLGAMGFAAMLAAAGLLTLHSAVVARWIGVVALLGALAFVVTFFTLLAGLSEDSAFGYGFAAGFLALAIWSIAMSIAAYRAVPRPGRR